MTFLYEMRLDQGEFFAVVTCESVKVSVLLSLCFENVTANWVCSAHAGLAFALEDKEHGLIFELSLVWRKRCRVGNCFTC